MNERKSLQGFPINLLVSGRRCLVVGGGRIAARKIGALLDQGAIIHVVSPSFCEEIQQWSQNGEITTELRKFQPADLDDVWLAVAATDSNEVNRSVFDAGEERHIWVNAADDPANCSATLMSVIRQSDITVAVGTNGRSPALTKFLTARIRADIGPEWSTLIELLSERREEIRSSGRSSEDADWQSVLNDGLIDLIREGDTEKVREILASL